MISIRKMTQEDVVSVMRIEQEVVDFPWTYSIYSDCIKVGYSCWVLEENQDILGYGLFSMAIDEAHILNLVIRADKQHQGLGQRLLTHLIETAQKDGATVIFLEVRVSNKIAYDLYIKMGFEVVGERKDYYQTYDGYENALVLRKDVTNAQTI